MRVLFLAAVALLGCGADADGPPSELYCEPSDRSGAYLTEFETVSGNCGDQATIVGRVDASSLGTGCELTAPDVWRNNDCTLERSTRCLDESIGPGFHVQFVGTTTQEDESGARLTGLVTVTVTDGAGAQVCVGTYRLVATRQ